MQLCSLTGSSAAIETCEPALAVSWIPGKTMLIHLPDLFKLDGYCLVNSCSLAASTALIIAAVECFANIFCWNRTIGYPATDKKCAGLENDRISYHTESSSLHSTPNLSSPAWVQQTEQNEVEYLSKQPFRALHYFFQYNGLDLDWRLQNQNVIPASDLAMCCFWNKNLLKTTSLFCMTD